MGNGGKTLPGMAERQLARRDGSLGPWDSGPGQNLGRAGSTRESLAACSSRCDSLSSGVFPDTIMGCDVHKDAYNRHGANKKHREIILIYPGKLVDGRSSVSGFCLH